jgi:hypothetical protein
MAIPLLHISKMNGVSGSENHLLTLLSHLDRSRFEIHLCILAEARFLQNLQSYKAHLEQDGIHVSIQVMRRHVDPRLIEKLRAYMQSKQIQIVHTHLIHADLYGTLAANLAVYPCDFFQT